MRSATDTTDDRSMDQDHDSNNNNGNSSGKETTVGPPPSLWPEPPTQPTQPIPTTRRRVRFNFASETVGTTSATLDASLYHQQGSESSGCVTSSGDSATTQAGSSSTFPSSAGSSSNIPRARPVGPKVTNTFQKHYPRWFSYPPHNHDPRQFDTKKAGIFVDCDSFDPTDEFLERSSAFQDYVEQKNAARIRLRHNPEYESLVDTLHRCQYLVNQGPTPEIRVSAGMEIHRLRAQMAEERKKWAASELQHIKDIEEAWMTFASIDEYEQTVARQRHAASLPRIEPKKTLSRVESLLGSDGSSLGIATWTKACSLADSQTALNKMLHAENGAEPTDPQSHGANRHTVDSVENPHIDSSADSWPDRPYQILVPDWFHTAESLGKLQTSGATSADRFNNLLNYIHQLEFLRGQRDYQTKDPTQQPATKNPNWDKKWHEPSPGWRHEHQRIHGGLWKCRKGPTAPEMEKRCRLCSDAAVQERSDPKKLLGDVMKCIEEAMAIVAENDKKEVQERMASEAYKPKRLTVFWHQDEKDPDNAGTPDVSCYTRQPRINYNPLRGIDDAPATIKNTTAPAQPRTTDDRKQKLFRAGENAQENSRVSQFDFTTHITNS